MARRWFGASSGSSSPDISPLGDVEGQGLWKSYDNLPQQDLAADRRFRLQAQMDKLAMDAAAKDKEAQQAATAGYNVPLDAHEIDIGGQHYKQLAQDINAAKNDFYVNPLVRNYISKTKGRGTLSSIQPTAEEAAAYAQANAKLAELQQRAQHFAERKAEKTAYQTAKKTSEFIANPQAEASYQSSDINVPLANYGKYADVAKAIQDNLLPIAKQNAIDQNTLKQLDSQLKVIADPNQKGTPAYYRAQQEITQFNLASAQKLAGNYYDLQSATLKYIEPDKQAFVDKWSPLLTIESNKLTGVHPNEYTLENIKHAHELSKLKYGKQLNKEVLGQTVAQMYNGNGEIINIPMLKAETSKDRIGKEHNLNYQTQGLFTLDNRPESKTKLQTALRHGMPAIATTDNVLYKNQYGQVIDQATYDNLPDNQRNREYLYGYIAPDPQRFLELKLNGETNNGLTIKKQGIGFIATYYPIDGTDNSGNPIYSEKPITVDIPSIDIFEPTRQENIGIVKEDVERRHGHKGSSLHFLEDKNTNTNTNSGQNTNTGKKVTTAEDL